MTGDLDGVNPIVGDNRMSVGETCTDVLGLKFRVISQYRLSSVKSGFVGALLSQQPDSLSHDLSALGKRFIGEDQRR